MKYRIPYLAISSLTLSTVLAGCGWGILGWGGDGGGSNHRVTVVGTIDDVTPDTDRDIVVFVFSVDDNGSDGALCPCPGLPCNLNSGDSVVIENGQTSFELDRLRQGAVRVVFLLDEPGDQADGRIDDGDPVAVLDDEGCELDNVPNRNTVTLSDIDIEFNELDMDELDARCDDGNDTTTTDEDDFCDVNNPPAVGRARAEFITVRDQSDDTTTSTSSTTSTTQQ